MSSYHETPTSSLRFPSRRALLGGTAAAAGVTLLPQPAEAAQPRRPARGSTDFVRVHGRQFRLGGSNYSFGGTNTYYLHQRSHYMIDAALDDAAAMSLAVVRCWAFADGPAQDKPLQPKPFVYDEDNFDSLDYAVWKAGQLGLRLVLTLVNNWPDYGGMQQYVSWFLGLSDDGYGDAVHHDMFYKDPQIRACYKAYAKHVIRRRNRYTGLRYNEDPTVMTFELANEPRNRSDKTGETVLGWVREMSAWIKHFAPHQLVAVGDEGFYGDSADGDYPYSDYEGNHWKQFLSVPTVDYGTVHAYPQSWGETSSSKPGVDPVDWGQTWIRRHLDDGRRLRIPVVVEEYGLQIDATKDVPDTARRDEGYRLWTEEVERAGAGDQFWLLTSRVDDGSFYPDYDGFRVVWRNDDDNPSNSTAQLLSAHAKTMSTR